MKTVVEDAKRPKEPRSLMSEDENRERRPRAGVGFLIAAASPAPMHPPTDIGFGERCKLPARFGAEEFRLFSAMASPDAANV